MRFARQHQLIRPRYMPHWRHFATTIAPSASRRAAVQTSSASHALVANKRIIAICMMRGPARLPNAADYTRIVRAPMLEEPDPLIGAYCRHPWPCSCVTLAWRIQRADTIVSTR